MAEKKQLTVSGVLKDLADGLSRKEIKEKYSLDSNDMKKLFDHPKLKGRRTKKATSFVLEDDVQEEIQPKKSSPRRVVTAEATTGGEEVVVEQTVATVTSAPQIEEEQDEVIEQPVLNDTPSGEIREISSPDDNVEVAEVATPAVETKKGLW